jgi:hypothetical protein
VSGWLILAFAGYIGATAVVFALRDLPLVVRRILRVYACYGLIAFAVRGLYLATTQPEPRLNDPMPIAPLYRFGYDAGIARILWYQTLSLLVVAGVVWLLYRFGAFASRRAAPLRARLSPAGACGLLVAYLIGWAFRLSNLGRFSDTLQGSTHFNDSPFAKLAVLSLIVPAVILLATEWWERGSTERRLLLVLVPCEVGWVFLGDTKAPIVALVVAAYIGAPAIRRTTRQRRRHTAAFTVMALCALILFSVVNGERELESSTGVARSDAIWETSTQMVTSPGGFADATLSRLLVRLDGLSAATDAYLPPHPRYMGEGEAARRAAELAVPSIVLGSVKESPGLLWSERMAGTKGTVSLAEGAAPEGYAIGGLTGLLTWSGLLGLVVVVAGSLMTRSKPLSAVRFVVAAFVGSSAFYERGMLGLIENAATALQVGVLAWLVFVLVYQLLRRRRTDISTTRTGKVRRRSLILNGSLMQCA